MQKQKIVGLSVLLTISFFLSYVPSATAKEASEVTEENSELTSSDSAIAEKPSIAATTDATVTPEQKTIYRIAAQFSKCAYSGTDTPLKSKDWTDFQWFSDAKDEVYIRNKIAKMTGANSSVLVTEEQPPTKEEVRALVDSFISSGLISTKDEKTLGFLTHSKSPKKRKKDIRIFVNADVELYEKSVPKTGVENSDVNALSDYAYAFGKNTKIISGKTVYVIAFRGTASKINAAIDALAIPVNFIESGTQVHAGFEVFRQECQRTPELTRFVTTIKNDTTPKIIIITGHSLGAAVAVLETAYLIESTDNGGLGIPAKDVHLIALAEPCPGTTGFVKCYEPKIKNYKWFWNALDIVPLAPTLIPKRLTGGVNYKHFKGRLISFDHPKKPITTRLNPLKKHKLQYYVEYINKKYK
jgi:hypothetical protein